MNQHLKSFRNAIRGGTKIFDLLKTDDDEAWAMGQHYGLKTPLLDFTYSPYIAAFFALINADPKESEYCTVYSVSKESIEGTKEYLVSIPLKPIIIKDS